MRADLYVTATVSDTVGAPSLESLRCNQIFKFVAGKESTWMHDTYDANAERPLPANTKLFGHCLELGTPWCCSFALVLRGSDCRCCCCTEEPTSCPLANAAGSTCSIMCPCAPKDSSGTKLKCVDDAEPPTLTFNTSIPMPTGTCQLDKPGSGSIGTTCGGETSNHCSTGLVCNGQSGLCALATKTPGTLGGLCGGPLGQTPPCNSVRSSHSTNLFCASILGYVTGRMCCF